MSDSQKVVVGFEPFDVDFVVGIKTFDKIPETLAVVVVNQVADFMDDDVIDDFVGGHDELAVKVEVVFARTAAPDGRNLFQDDAVVRNIEQLGEEIYLLGNNPLAIIEIPAEHGLLQTLFLFLRWMVGGNLGLEAVVEKLQSGGGDTCGRNNGEGVFLAEI